MLSAVTVSGSVGNPPPAVLELISGRGRLEEVASFHQVGQFDRWIEIAEFDRCGELFASLA